MTDLIRVLSLSGILRTIVLYPPLNLTSSPILIHPRSGSGFFSSSICLSALTDNIAVIFPPSSDSDPLRPRRVDLCRARPHAKPIEQPDDHTILRLPRKHLPHTSDPSGRILIFDRRLRQEHEQGPSPYPPEYTLDPPTSELCKGSLGDATYTAADVEAHVGVGCPVVVERVVCEHVEHS